MPTESVTVNLSVDRNTEAGLTDQSLTFTKADYATPQTVEVVGANDAILDGPINYTLRIEAFDGGYSGNVVTIDMVNEDNDTPGVRIVPPKEASTAEWVSETSILLELTYSPSEEVSVNVSVSDNTEAEPVSDAVTFDLLPNGIYTANVMVRGKDDTLSDSHQNYRVIFSDLVSDDSNFSGLPIAPVEMINYDDETSGIQIALTTSSSGNLITQEYNWGGASSLASISATDLSKLSTNTFTVSLLSSPAFGNVVINVNTSDALEAVVKSGEQLLFTSANYNIGQVVEIAGRDDEEVDGDTEYSINLSIDESTGDLFYRNFPDRGVSAINEEADLIITDAPNIDGTNANVYDLLEEDGLLTLVASEGRPDYTWTLITSPSGSSLDVDSSGVFQSTISGDNQQQLSFQVGAVPGLYEVAVSDTQISKETEVYDFYLRGSPMVLMNQVTRPTVNTLRIVFEDTAIVDRTSYVVEWSPDGEEPWTSLTVLNDTPQAYVSSKPSLSKQRGAASDSVSEYYLDVSFAQGGNPDSVGYFRMSAENTVGQKTTVIPDAAIQQTSQYIPLVAEDSTTDKILAGGAGGGGGGGCLLK